jgi:hypothetical protein
VAPPILAGFRPPDWLTSDWPLVGLGVALMAAVLFAVSALLGLVAAVAVAGSIEAAPCGAAVGSHLAFAAFGARTFAGCGSEHGAALAIGFLPLPWALMGGLVVEAARRFAWRRLPDDRGRRVAYAGKLAVSFGVALGIIAGLVARGDPTRRGSSFASSLNGGEVWFYTSVLTWFWAWLALRRQGLQVLPAPSGRGRANAGDGAGAVGAAGGLGSAGGLGGIKRLWCRAGEGAAVFGVLAAGLAVVGLLFTLVVVDSGASRIGVLLGFPVVGLSFGAALADAAMGAALGALSGHTSLTHFGLPARPGAGAAPVWVFAAVGLAPSAVAATVWRRLERERPAEEQGALAVGAATGLGFAVAAWAAALLGRIVVLASVGRTDVLASEKPIGAFVAARPNPAAVLGLGLLWGLAGGLGAAFLWASRHNARWQIDGTPVLPGPAAEPAPPTTETWLLPETPPTVVPPPTVPETMAPETQVFGDEGSSPAAGDEGTAPGEKP